MVAKFTKLIDLKDYPARFAMCGLPIVKVGINFDADKRTIGDWKLTSKTTRNK